MCTLKPEAGFRSLPLLLTTSFFESLDEPKARLARLAGQ